MITMKLIVKVWNKLIPKLLWGRKNRLITLNHHFIERVESNCWTLKYIEIFKRFVAIQRKFTRTKLMGVKEKKKIGLKAEYLSHKLKGIECQDQWINNWHLKLKAGSQCVDFVHMGNRQSVCRICVCDACFKVVNWCNAFLHRSYRWMSMAARWNGHERNCPVQFIN